MIGKVGEPGRKGVGQVAHELIRLVCANLAVKDVVEVDPVVHRTDADKIVVLPLEVRVMLEGT